MVVLVPICYLTTETFSAAPLVEDFQIFSRESQIISCAIKISNKMTDIISNPIINKTIIARKRSFTTDTTTQYIM